MCRDAEIGEEVTAFNQDWYLKKSAFTVTPETWATWRIGQELDGGQHKQFVEVDGVRIKENMVNSKPQTFEKMKVYANINYDEELPGAELRRFIFHTGTVGNIKFGLIENQKFVGLFYFLNKKLQN